jgi:SAM-dependent methyltransferase
LACLAADKLWRSVQWLVALTKEVAVNDSAGGQEISERDDSDGAVKLYKRDFWSKENLKFIHPHFRLRKAARIVNRMARGKDCDLLDVGCGPATLMKLLDDNIHYYGIDIAIQEPAPNLMETDFIEMPVRFGDKRFDIVLAQGVFEYVGEFQSAKFAEISALLQPGGQFICSYMNFGHLNKSIHPLFNNVQSIQAFRKSLSSYFGIVRSFPVGHNRNMSAPQKKWLQAIQMHMNLNIPVISPVLASEYLFICSAPVAGSPPGQPVTAEA